MNKKRIRAFWLAVVFALSVVVPVRQANSAFPLIALGVMAYNAAGAVVTTDILAAGVSALIGGTIVALAITPSTADAPMRVPLVSDQPTIDAVMPPPAAPATAAKVTKFDWYNNFYYSDCVAAIASNFPRSAGATWQEACSAIGGTASGGGCTKSVAPVSQCNMAETATFLAWAVEDCPTGYTQSGSTCVLVNARVAVPDQKYDVPVPAGGGAGYQAPSSGQEGDSMPKYASFSGGKVYASGKDSSGRPVQIEYAVSPDGTKTYITHYTQTEDAAQTTVKTQSITVDRATGQVTGATAATAAGSITAPTSANAVGTVTTGAAITSGAASSSPIVFPTDYARAGEAGAAATTINTKLDTLHRDLTEKGADIADPVAPEASAFSNAFFNGTFGNLLAWRLPAHTSECPTVTFDYMMFSSHQVHHMDAQCTIAEQIRPVLSVVMVVVWTVVALFVLLEA